MKRRFPFLLQRRLFSAPGKVRICTGNRRGSGTRAVVSVRLCNHEGVWTESFTLGNADWRRNSIVPKTINLPDNFGRVEKLEIGHNNEEIGAGWFLDKVMYEDDHLHLTFPCHHWLGDADSIGESGPSTVVLYPQRRAETSPKPARDLEELCVRSCVAGTPAHFKLKEVENVRDLCSLKKTFGFAGEDSYFRTVTKSGQVWVGVADGVYEWRNKGVDPSLYSRGLMQKIQESIDDSQSLEQIVEKGFEEMKKTDIQGSCTISIAKIDLKKKRLDTYVLGDSLVMVWRWDETDQTYHPYFESNELEHHFGCPKQLGSHKSSSTVDEGEMTVTKIRAGDVVLVASDGLFDNLHGEEVTSLMTKMIHGENNLDAFNRQLVLEAYEASLDPVRDTPYSRCASENFDMIYSGGKQDDICCIALLLQHTPDSMTSPY